MDTRHIIIDAAFRVLERKPFDEIIVQDFLDEAKVSRKTFYNYFRDKYELMYLYYEDYATNSVLKRYDGHNWCSLVEDLFTFILDKRVFFKNISGTVGPESFWEFFFHYSFEFYKSVLLKNKHRNTLTPQEHFIIVGICSSDQSIVKEYLKDNKGLTPKDLAQLICDLIPEEYYTLQDGRGKE